MNRFLIYLLAGIIIILNSSNAGRPGSKHKEALNDGPYIFNNKGKLKAVSISEGRLVEEEITPLNFSRIKEKFSFSFTYNDLLFNHLKKIDYEQSYKMVDSISIISDIHGEYDTYINLLKSVGIIDRDLNWKFGTGHLVVLGDVFDRGEKVTEVLWHLYGLEKQAAEAGGMVHLLLGNHEIMVMSEDLEYINLKYRLTEALSGKSYSGLFSRNTVLGNWIRSKPVVITINDIIFVHGGISQNLVQRRLSIKNINALFSEKIVGKVLKEPDPSGLRLLQDTSLSDPGIQGGGSGTDADAFREMEELLFLAGNSGPVWYRGYFTDPEFTEKELDPILGFYKMNHIVVGHTTCENIDSQYGTKIVGVDAGIGIGQAGEMLLYKNGNFFVAYSTSDRIRLQYP